MKGIILAGGSGTRLHPMTIAISKQLLPVYDKPMIYYPLTVLMQAGIQDIMVISAPTDLPQFRRLLGTGEHLGLRFSYAEQPRPEGLAQAFHIAAEWLAGAACALVLGDNMIFGEKLVEKLERAVARPRGATVFGYHVRDPGQYGVISMNRSGRPAIIEEKPRKPRSNWAVIGLYFYDHRVTELASQIRPSNRNELEITDLNRLYLEAGDLNVEFLGRGCAWLDAGTPDSLLQASNFVQTIQTRQGMLVGCPEEVAYRMGYIDAGQLMEHATRLSRTELGKLLAQIAAKEDNHVF